MIAESSMGFRSSSGLAASTEARTTIPAEPFGNLVQEFSGTQVPSRPTGEMGAGS
jgi:hypothetical protein